MAVYLTILLYTSENHKTCVRSNNKVLDYCTKLSIFCTFHTGDFMKVLSSTEVRQNFSAVLSAINVEPISISKQDKEIAVVISTQRYRELKRLEDILYGKAAELAIKEGFASNKETQDLMGSIA